MSLRLPFIDGRSAAVLRAAGAWLLAMTLVGSASATIVMIEYEDRNGVGGFPDNGGPHWSGFVDTIADTLLIFSWTDLPGTPEFWTPMWTPDLTISPLVWPAVSSTGTPYDVPDDFLGHIDATFAFISPVPAQQMHWNEGVWGQTPELQLPASIDFYPGWGGVRKPATINGVVVWVWDTSADETEMPLLPIAALGLAGSTGATVTAFVSNAEPIPEAGALLLCAAAAGLGMFWAIWRFSAKSLRGRIPS